MSRIIINAGANQIVNVRGNGETKEELEQQARLLIPTMNYGAAEDYTFTYRDSEESEDGDPTLTAERQVVAGSKGADGGMPVFLKINGIEQLSAPVALDSVEDAEPRLNALVSAFGLDPHDFTRTDSGVDTVDGSDALVITYDRANIVAGSKGARL